MIDRWQNSEILLLGGSAGSFKILFSIIKYIGPELNKVVIIVMHRKKNFASEVERLFAQNSLMPLKEVSDKDLIKRGSIYIAPANYHLLIEKNGCFGLDVSDAVWFSKPSIDITFESAADVYRDRCTAILLSGANQDGAQGLLKLKIAGSMTIAQDPKDAELAEMPREAINIGAADYVLNTREIYDLIKGQY